MRLRPGHARRLSLALVLAACTTWDSRVRDEIVLAIQRAGEGGVVDVGALGPLEWERLYVFAPYTSAARIDSTLGFRSRGAWRDGIARSDAIALLVFVHDGRVRDAVELPRAAGDMSTAYRRAGYPRDSARFRVVRDGELGDGRPRLTVVPAP